jgi:hypothetical protein
VSFVILVAGVYHDLLLASRLAGFKHRGDHVGEILPLIQYVVGDFFLEHALLDIVAGHLLAAARGDENDRFARFLDRGRRAEIHNVPEPDDAA